MTVAGQAQLGAAVLGQAPFGDVQARHDLEAGSDARCQGARRFHHLAQHPVHPHAHAVAVFVGFEMEVGGAGVDGVQHEFVDEAHHRSVVHLGGQGRGLQVLVGLHLDLLQAGIGQVGEGVRLRLAQPRQGPIQGDRIGEYRIQGEAGVEGQPVDGIGGGVVHRHEQALAAAIEGQHPQGAGLFGGDGARRLRIHLQGLQVHQGQAELRRGQGQQARLGDLLARPQLRQQGTTGTGGVLLDAPQRLRVQQPLAQQAPGEPAGQGGRGRSETGIHGCPCRWSSGVSPP